jgi:hypothetical protein
MNGVPGGVLKDHLAFCEIHRQERSSHDFPTMRMNSVSQFGQRL